MSWRRTAATLADLAAMVGVALAIWFGWNPLLAYLPNGLAADIDAVGGWFGATLGAGGWVGWLDEVEWLAGALVVVLLLWAGEKLVGAVRRGLDERG